jgi:hypothetical protein
MHAYIQPETDDDGPPLNATELREETALKIYEKDLQKALILGAQVSACGAYVYMFNHAYV